MQTRLFATRREALRSYLPVSVRDRV